jgi:hypothetical protein
MTQLFTKNAKLKKAEYNTVNFGIPALKTCPSKDICGKYCYANKGAFIWPQVKAAYEYRYQATKQADFIEVATSTLAKKRATHIRCHDSGDFYNKEYLYKWFAIAEEMPEKVFYAYTKRVKLLKENWTNKPKNFIIIFSLGGKEDHLIDMENDRHSRIFKTKQELLDNGYIDASQNDSNAIKENHKVGLIMH